MTTYYFTWEDVAEIGIEPQGFLGIPVPSANFQAISHLRNAVIDVNDNLVRDADIGAATGRASSGTHKGMHEVDVQLTMWMPDDLDSVALDVWFQKL